MLFLQLRGVKMPFAWGVDTTPLCLRIALGRRSLFRKQHPVQATLNISITFLELTLLCFLLKQIWHILGFMASYRCTCYTCNPALAGLYGQGGSSMAEV